MIMIFTVQDTKVQNYHDRKSFKIEGALEPETILIGIVHGFCLPHHYTLRVNCHSQTQPQHELELDMIMTTTRNF